MMRHISSLAKLPPATCRNIEYRISINERLGDAAHLVTCLARHHLPAGARRFGGKGRRTASLTTACCRHASLLALRLTWPCPVAAND